MRRTESRWLTYYAALLLFFVFMAISIAIGWMASEVLTDVGVLVACALGVLGGVRLRSRTGSQH